MNETTTYLLVTCPEKQSFFTTTLEKYYGDLIEERVFRPAGICGLIHFETTHELPSDAFR
jgi:hypothetical protein